MLSNDSERLKRRASWTTGEKWLLGSIVVALAAGIGIWAGFNSLEQMPDIKIPARTEPSPNGYAYFVAAADNAVEGGSSIITPRPRKTDAHPEQWLIKRPSAVMIAADRRVAPQNAAALALLRQGLSLPCLAPGGTDPNVPRPMSKFRHLARATRDTAIAMAADGHWTAAVNTAIDGLALGEQMTRGGTIIDFFTGRACQGTARNALWPMLSQMDSKAARIGAQRILSVDAQATPFGDILTMDKWATLRMLMQAFRNPTWRADLLKGASGGGDEADAAQARALTFISKRALVNAYVKRVDDAIAISRGPFRPNADPPRSSITYVDEDLMTQTGDLWLRYCQQSVDNRLLGTALALRAYHLEHGSYPATLDALVPAYLPAIPKDPFSTTALKYKLAGGVYTLYSVGPDGKDDGGKPVYDRNAGSPYYVQMSSHGDIIAGLNE